MSKLLRNRWLNWSFVAGMLIALGCGIYQIQPPAPMCVIVAGELTPLRFADGGRLVTLPGQAGELHDAHGPVQVWDTRTGVEIASYFKKDQTLSLPAFSKDGRYFVTDILELDNHCLVLLDIIAGTSRELPLPDECGSVLDFSPSGDLLARWLFGDDEVKELQIFDTSNCRLLDERESLGFEEGEVFTGKALLHKVPTKTKVTNAEIWSTHDRKAVATLENAGPNSAHSLDGRFYVAERLGPDGQSIGKWAVWNLCSHRIEVEFQSEISAASLPVLTENGRWLAAFCKGKQGSYVELRETHTGK
jgi:hypothetical protein